MLDAIKDLAPLLGRIQSRANARRLREMLGCKPEIKRYEASVYWCYKKAGVDVFFLAGRLRTFFLHGHGSPDEPAFQGTLTDGLTAQETRKRIHAVLAPPEKTFPPETVMCDECKEDHVISRDPWRDRHFLGRVSLYIEYSSGLHQWAVRPRMIHLDWAVGKTLIKPSPAPEVAAKGKTWRCTFMCARCRKPAETVELRLPDGLLRRCFGGEEAPVDPQKAERLAAALRAGDAAALHGLNPYWAASYCPQCRACYCSRHWTRREGPPSWGDSYSWDWVEFGACPYGHERILREL